MRRRNRRAFTTLELLVVIGIILLLMAISVLGFRHFDRLASAKQTRAQLNLCKNMLIEYERANGLKYLEGPPPVPTTAVPPMYVDRPGPPQVPAIISLADLSAGGSSDVSGRSSNASPRYAAAAVLRMRVDDPVSGAPSIMKTLARVPSIRAMLSNIPSNRLLEPQQNQFAVFDPAPGNQNQVAAGVVLDGWGNPIIFVPAGGMVVNIKDPTNASGPPIPFLVRSSGTQRFTGQAPPLTARDRPFFASAGQDGFFTTDQNGQGSGDDNIYSFQQD